MGKVKDMELAIREADISRLKGEETRYEIRPTELCG